MIVGAKGDPAYRAPRAPLGKPWTGELQAVTLSSPKEL